MMASKEEQRRMTGANVASLVATTGLAGLGQAAALSALGASEWTEESNLEAALG